MVFGFHPVYSLLSGSFCRDESADSSSGLSRAETRQKWRQETRNHYSLLLDLWKNTMGSYLSSGWYFSSGLEEVCLIPKKCHQGWGWVWRFWRLELTWAVRIPNRHSISSKPWHFFRRILMTLLHPLDPAVLSVSSRRHQGKKQLKTIHRRR